MRVLTLLLGLALLGCGNYSISDDKTSTETCDVLVTWEPPATRINGWTLTDDQLEKYTIYVNLTKDPTKEGTLVLVADVTNTEARSWVVEGVHKGSVWFYITVTDLEGRVSPYSNLLNVIC